MDLLMQKFNELLTLIFHLSNLINSTEIAEFLELHFWEQYNLQFDSHQLGFANWHTYEYLFCACESLPQTL